MCKCCVSRRKFQITFQAHRITTWRLYGKKYIQYYIFIKPNFFRYRGIPLLFALQLASYLWKYSFSHTPTNPTLSQFNISNWCKMLTDIRAVPPTTAHLIFRGLVLFVSSISLTWRDLKTKLLENEAVRWTVGTAGRIIFSYPGSMLATVAKCSFSLGGCVNRNARYEDVVTYKCNFVFLYFERVWACECSYHVCYVSRMKKRERGK